MSFRSSFSSLFGGGIFNKDFYRSYRRTCHRRTGDFSVKTTSVKTRWRERIGKFTVEIALYSRFGTGAVSVNEEIAAQCAS